MAEVWHVLDQPVAEEVGMLPDVGGEGLRCRDPPEDPDRLGGEEFEIQAVREGALRKAVGKVVGASVADPPGVDKEIHACGIHERAVRRHAQQGICRSVLDHLQQAPRQILLRSPHAADPFPGADGLDDLVLRGVWAGYDDRVKLLGEAEPLPDPYNHGAAMEKQERLTGQACGAHAGLNRGDHSFWLIDHFSWSVLAKARYPPDKPDQASRDSETHSHTQGEGCALHGLLAPTR